MRKRTAVAMSVVAVSALAAATATTAAASGSRHGPRRAGAGEHTRTVSYAGYHVRVPTSWPVYDLSADPTRCVRFDRHAVYLGRPGPDQNCPAHAVGRTEALLVEPISPATPGSSRDDAGNGVLHADLPREGVSVTVSYGEDVTRASALLPAATPTPTGAAPHPVEPTLAASPGPSGTVRRWLPGRPVSPALIAHGYGFDTCAAPSLQAMYAWRPSVMNTVGIYVGGVNRACPDGNLSAAWVRTVRGYGYSFIPTYVGRQPPCTPQSWAKIDPRPGYAYAQGAAAGDDAAARMRGFGFGPGNPVYLDIEFYDGDADCAAAVRTFTAGWVHHLHAAGYVAGFYSTAASGVRDIAAAWGPTSYQDLPDALWFARWNQVANLDAEPYVPHNWWPARRAKQYTGGHPVRISGMTINIDSDYLYGPVALPGSY